MPAKGQKWTDDQKALRAEKMRQRWQSPDYRARCIEGMKKRPPMTESTKLAIRNAVQGKPLAEEHKEKLREASKRKWEDPEYREKVVAAVNQPHVKQILSSPERGKKISESKKVMWANMDPEEKRRRLHIRAMAGGIAAGEHHKVRPVSEETRNKMRAHWKAYVLTPEGKEHVGKAIVASRRGKKRDTSIEMAVHGVLKELGIVFESQASIGPYFPDFYLPERKLIIECDGDYWHSTERAKGKDRIRDRWFQERGYTVIRLRECDINRDARACVFKALELR